MNDSKPKTSITIKFMLEGEPTEIAKKYIGNIQRGVPVPDAKVGIAGAGKWDFVLSELAKFINDPEPPSVDVAQKDAGAFFGRAKKFFNCSSRKIADRIVKDEVSGTIIETIPMRRIWLLSEVDVKQRVPKREAVQS